MLAFGSFFNDAPTGVGFMAGSIAVGGFLAHARPALAGRDDQALRSATIRGGIGGLSAAVLVSFAAFLTG
jgi:hypothetical protein